MVIVSGANDYTAAFKKASASAELRKHPGKAFDATPATVEHNIETAIDTIHRLNPDTRIAVFDYWAAMKDGAVARNDYSKAQLQAAGQATASLNRALPQA